MLMIGSIDECLDRIKAINENNRLRIECLEKENQFLREEYNKDEEVKKNATRVGCNEKRFETWLLNFRKRAKSD